MVGTNTLIESLESRQLLSVASPLSELSVAAAPQRPAVQASAKKAAGITGSVRLGTQRLPVSIVRPDGRPARLFANRETWVVVHGHNDSPDAFYLQELADALQARSKRIRVVMLDWSSPASQPIFSAFSWGAPVGQWAAGKLEAAGLTTSRINIIGHSLGGTVVDELAASVTGGVNRIVALDPAGDPTGLLGADYAANSQYSLAFIGSSFSTETLAFSADTTIRLSVGKFSSILTHANVVDLFSSMLERNNTAKPDRISKLFNLKQLSPAVVQPWAANSGGYEGTLTGKVKGDDWVPSRFVYTAATTGLPVTLRA